MLLPMEYLIGVILAACTAALGVIVGFERDRAFYSVVLIVVATYYILFAAMGANRSTLLMEIVGATVFLVFAVIGYKKSAWIVAAGLVGHGVFDFVHHGLIADPGVPQWWPGFCAAYDIALGAWLAARLARRSHAQRAR
jgi:hypothetical protein